MTLATSPKRTDFLARNRPAFFFVAELLWLDMLEACAISTEVATWYTMPHHVGLAVEFHFEGLTPDGRTWKQLAVMTCEEIDLGYPLGRFAHFASGFISKFAEKGGK